MTGAKKEKPKKGNPNDRDAALILDDGSVFWGYGAGKRTSATGEICFNT